NAAKIDDLGRLFGSDLYEAEVRYLIDNEWAVTAHDVLWRRTKKGLYLSAEEAAALGEYMVAAPMRMAG
ncbi:glycerol-3-phosphate dehydrogenase C-terminal domain-containing protein, partial [Rhizobium sp. BK379]|uniref:glycerol-3-phosphate dehydrogenase C-terminal domain-containing protein n=1 Tax=Rhizobium sp. BK379 TaxID=2587059 RepID=UPI0017E81698